MSNEQPAILAIPDRQEFKPKKRKPPAAPDYSSKAWQSDLPYARGEFGQKATAKRPPSRFITTEPMEDYPSQPKIIRMTKKVGKLNPPPVGERKAIHVSNILSTTKAKHGANGRRVLKQKRGK